MLRVSKPHFFLLKSGETRVFACGANNYGQTLGAPIIRMGGYPTNFHEITFLRDKGIQKIACGAWHSVVLSGSFV
jgi:alpha-tubulin suppressor-like RCC1 family protein